MAVHLALDIGEATVGLAACDADETHVRALYTLTRTGRERDLDLVVEEAERLGAEVIVVGLALRSDGSEGDSARRARWFGQRLATLTGLTVVYQDEHLSSFEATERLRALGLSGPALDARLDAEAARVILEDYLATRPEPG